MIAMETIPNESLNSWLCLLIKTGILNRRAKEDIVEDFIEQHMNTKKGKISFAKFWRESLAWKWKVFICILMKKFASGTSSGQEIRINGKDSVLVQSDLVVGNNLVGDALKSAKSFVYLACLQIGLSCSKKGILKLAFIISS